MSDTAGERIAVATSAESTWDAPANPFTFIQWKGTDVCLDLHCECGEHSHLDGYFAYVIKCGRCGAEWQMPTYMTLIRHTPAMYDHRPLVTELDDDG